MGGKTRTNSKHSIHILVHLFTVQHGLPVTMFVSGALLLLLFHSIQSDSLFCYNSTDDHKVNCTTDPPSYCYALTIAPDALHPERRPYEPPKSPEKTKPFKGCDRDHKCEGNECYTDPGFPDINICCCDQRDLCNKPNYFWLSCFSDLLGSNITCNNVRFPSGACYITRTKDAKQITLGCAAVSHDPRKNLCFEAENKCRYDSKGDMTCCCYESLCNTEEFMRSKSVNCWDTEEERSVKCPLGISQCFTQTWTQHGRPVPYPPEVKGCATGDQCSGVDEFGCKRVAEATTSTERPDEPPSPQTCCCNGSDCNERPYFWLKCLKQGEEEVCSYGEQQPTGACFVKRHADGRLENGCEWRNKRKCRGVKDKCETNAKGGVVCCCFQPNCNTQSLLPVVESKAPNKISSRIAIGIMYLCTYYIFF